MLNEHHEIGKHYCVSFGVAKIRVLHIIKSLGRGGAEMLLPETLRLHNRENFEFHYIYFLPWKNAMVQSIRDVGGKVICIHARNNIELVLRSKQVACYAREHDIQLIHAHLPWAGIVARIVGRITKLPVLYTEHNKLERYHTLTRWMNLLTMDWLTRIIAVSEDVADSIRKFKPAIKIPLQTIVNGVNIERFAPVDYSASVRDALSIPAEAPIIGTIAVFRSQKRLDLWLEIAKQIILRVPSVHFILVGGGPLLKELESKRKALGLEHRVHFVGVQTEVRPYLASFNLYMMTSIFEGLPIALLEAMASGCPVICTDAGGIKEVITHGSDGLMCSVDEPYKLVSYAVELLQDEDKRGALANRGRKKIVENFSMNTMVAELEKCYESEALNHSRF